MNIESSWRSGMGQEKLRYWMRWQEDLEFEASAV